MLTSIGDIMREAYRRGLVTTRDGNISVRRQNKFYITPSGGRKTIIHPEHILKAFITNDELVWRDTGTLAKPSGELKMHISLQLVDDGFKGCRAVVHLHPTFTIAAMHAGFDLQDLSQQFPEVSRYTRVAENIPVLPVTSDILAEHTLNALAPERAVSNYTVRKLENDIVGQAGHGVCAIGKSPWDAFEHIERVEHICQIVLASGVRPK